MGKPLIVRRAAAVAPGLTVTGDVSITGTLAPKQAEQTTADVVPLHQADEVLATVPKAFTLTDDDHAPHKYPVGTYMMPREHVTHWYAKAYGVSPANTTKPVTA